MSTPIAGLRTAIYKVSDLEAAKKWYSKAFQVDPYFDEPFYVGFNVGGYELGLMQSDIPSGDKTFNVATYWGVENIEEEVARFIELGATEIEPPTNVGGPIVVASIKDPWGNAVGLIFNPTFKIN